MTFFIIILTSCGQSPEDKILGMGELDESGEEKYWDITADRIYITSDADDVSFSTGYTLAEIEGKDHKEFRIEFDYPQNGSNSEYESFFDYSIEGYFENKNIIVATSFINSSSVGEFELSRMKKDEAENVDSKNATSSSVEKMKLNSTKNIDYLVPESWAEKLSDEDLKYYYTENGMLMVSYVDFN